MIEHTTRLIFNGLIRNAHPEKIIDCFKNEFGFSEDAIRVILTSPPRVLPIVSNRAKTQDIRDTLEEAGARIELQVMADDASCPLPLTKNQYNTLVIELEKASKGDYSLAVFISRISLQQGPTTQPSMLVNIGESVESQINETVSAFAVDDTTLILLEFFCDDAMAGTTCNKLNQALANHFSSDTDIKTNWSIYPDDAGNLPDLIQSILAKSDPEQAGQQGSYEQKQQKVRLSLDILSEGETALELYQQILVSARGKQFKWLSERTVDELWLGLGSMPPVRQQEFLLRLPLDSPLINDLDQYIRDKRIPTSDPDSQRKIDELLIQIRGVENEGDVFDIRDEIAKKIKSVDTFPTLTAVAGKIATIAKNPASTIEDLTNIIKNDPSLTLTLLKIVNSAFYGFPQKIETIERAVIILGRVEVVNLSLGIAAAKAIDITPVTGLYQPKTLWHHLMGTALISRYLCDRFNKNDEQGLFTAGLLHDLGKIFLVDHYADSYGKLHIEAGEFTIPIYELEEEWFGINHALIGKSIASYWNLPEPLIQAAAFHHQPYFATEHSQLAAIVGFADFLYHKACPSTELSQVVTPHSPCLTHGHWMILEQVFPTINMSDIEPIIQEVSDLIGENQSIFAILH